MTDPVTLLFGVHAHQPAGNFPEVIDHAHERCYGPFLRTMADYPAFRFSVHFSGPLLDDLAARYPDDIELLRQMAARGQVEMFGAGDTEPVLAAIPYRDRLSQIDALSAKLARRFGAAPRGAWLTERVWESSVVPALARCGIRYATVDDYHFLCAGRAQDELDRHFTTEEDGHTLDIFPISEALRYRIPFATAGDAVAHLESMAVAGRRAAAIYFDDIEKLGVWPETHEWVYGKRWLREFVERVLASPQIRTSTFADHHAAERTGGIVYLPTTSYIEMNEWSLPAGPAGEYAAFVAAEKSAGRYDARKGFLRGGIWRNFMSRYPEANWMHKRMLALSGRLAALPPGPPHDELRPLLHLAQANDAYWHGLFGGLYLPHLRRGVWRHLLLLEAGLDRVAPRPRTERLDLDHDGVDDVFFTNDAAQVAVRMDGSAAVAEIDSYRLAQNFGDTLRRHAEHYHAKARDGAESTHGGDEGIASAHDRVAFKHAITARRARARRRAAPRVPRPLAGCRRRCRGAFELRGDARRGHHGGVRGARRRDEDRQDDCARRRDRHRALPRARRRGRPAFDHARPRDAELRRRRGPLSGRRVDSRRLRPAARSRAGERSRARRPAHGRQRRAAPRSACARHRAALPHGVAVGGRLRARDAVGDARLGVERRGRRRQLRGAPRDPRRRRLTPTRMRACCYFTPSVALLIAAIRLFACGLPTAPRTKMSGGRTGLPKYARFQSSDRLISVPSRLRPP